MLPRLFAVLVLAAVNGCATTPPSYVVEGDAIAAPLVGGTVDPAQGQRVFTAREAGHCVLCHRVAGLDAPFQGNLGPDLTDVGSRLTPGQIRLRVVDASFLNPDTVMPPYYRTDGLEQVAAKYRGEPVLSATEVEQLVAWLAARKGVKNHGP